MLLLVHWPFLSYFFNVTSLSKVLYSLQSASHGVFHLTLTIMPVLTIIISVLREVISLRKQQSYDLKPGRLIPCHMLFIPLKVASQVCSYGRGGGILFLLRKRRTLLGL